MAENVTYSPVEIRGQAVDPIFAELFFTNRTISDNLVSFETDIKAGTIFTENDNTTVISAYSCGAPTTGGTIGLYDAEVSPKKLQSYIEFCPENLRTSRFKRSMKPGAWETVSNEFERDVLGVYSAQISTHAENLFWNAGTTALGALVASDGALTANTNSHERAFVTSNPYSGSSFNGVISTLIEDSANSRRYTTVTGDTITSANIHTEYAKLYAGMAPELTDAFEEPVIYAPKKHKQLINILNTSQTYRDLFSVENGNYFYNGVKINFVPLRDDTMLITLPSYVVWATDLLSDFNMLKIDYIAANREDMFVKTLFTLEAHVVNKKFATLYCSL